MCHLSIWVKGLSFPHDLSSGRCILRALQAQECHTPPLSCLCHESLPSLIFGRLIFIHLRCWEVLPFLTIQRKRCIKLRVLRAQDFFTPLPLNCQKGQHLPAPVVYKNQSPLYSRGWWGEHLAPLCMALVDPVGFCQLATECHRHGRCMAATERAAS